MALLFLPGTILHEISHMIVAGLLLVPVGEIDLWPQVEENGIRLGSIQVGKTDILRRFIIGIAPIVVGLFIMTSILVIFKETLLDSPSIWQIGLILYAVFEIGNTMFSSKKDLEGAFVVLISSLILLALILVGLLLTNHLPDFSMISKINLIRVEQIMQKVNLFLIIPIGINLLILGLTKLLRLKI